MQPHKVWNSLLRNFGCPLFLIPNEAVKLKVSQLISNYVIENAGVTPTNDLWITQC